MSSRIRQTATALAVCRLRGVCQQSATRHAHQLEARRDVSDVAIALLSLSVWVANSSSEPIRRMNTEHQSTVMHCSCCGYEVHYSERHRCPECGTIEPPVKITHAPNGIGLAERLHAIASGMSMCLLVWNATAAKWLVILPLVSYGTPVINIVNICIIAFGLWRSTYVCQPTAPCGLRRSSNYLTLLVTSGVISVSLCVLKALTS